LNLSWFLSDKSERNNPSTTKYLRDCTEYFFQLFITELKQDSGIKRPSDKCRKSRWLECHIDDAREVHVETIKELLRNKGQKVWSIGPDASVYDAVALMADKDIGALMVMKGDKPLGLISERDYSRNVILKGRSSKDTTVKEVMMTRVVGVRPDQKLEECMAIMTERRVRHLPVMNGTELVGIVSIGDLVKAVIDEQKFIIDQLINYITS
jgi:CBS domain-containing protein